MVASICMAGVAAAALTATLHGGAVTLVLYTLHYSNLQCSIALC